MNEADGTVPMFKSKLGHLFSGLGEKDLLQLREQLYSQYGLRPPQTCESAAFSLAMVVRFALGLSATDGRVCGLVADNLSGWVVLAALRHLMNGGAQTIVVLFEEPKSSDSEFSHQLKPLEKMGAEILRAPDLASSPSLAPLFQSCHNILSGLYRSGTGGDSSWDALVNVLNELQTPVHCVDAPLGINVDTGEKLSVPLFASSTLSLGAPFCGLSIGRDYVGRHYLCDISVAGELYSSKGPNLCPLFAEQPVVQIFPYREGEEEDSLEIPKEGQDG